MKSFLILLFIAIAGCSGSERKERISNADSANSQHDTLLIKTDNAVDLDTTETMFFVRAAYGGMIEVESSHKILPITLDSTVKDFAKVMLTDHGNANKNLKTLAESKGYKLPTVLPPSKIALINKMDEMKDEGRNEYYIQLMVEEHKNALGLFREASRVDDKEISQFAKDLLPILETHYHHISKLYSNFQKPKVNAGDDPLKLSDRNNQ